MAENAKAAGAGKAKGAAKGAAKGGGKGAAALTPGEIQIARMLVRALWLQESIAANPELSPAERAAQWKDVRQARNEAELKRIRRALLTLKKAGVVMTLPEKAQASGDAAEAVEIAEA